MKYIKGRLDAFWETGTKGVEWAFYDLHNKSDSLHYLDDGDYLLVYNRQDKLYFGKEKLIMI